MALPPDLSGFASSYSPYANALGLTPGMIPALYAGIQGSIPQQPTWTGADTHGITIGANGPIDPARWAQITAAEEARANGSPMQFSPQVAPQASATPVATPTPTPTPSPATPQSNANPLATLMALSTLSRMGPPSLTQAPMVGDTRNAQSYIAQLLAQYGGGRNG